MIETKLNRCDNCHLLSEDIEIFDGVRLCPECLNAAEGIDEPSGLDDLDDLASYGEGWESILKEGAEKVKREALYAHV